MAMNIYYEQLESQASLVFGSEEKAKGWLNSYNPVLGAFPATHAVSEQGLQDVLRVLAAIQQGGVV